MKVQFVDTTIIHPKGGILEKPHDVQNLKNRLEREELTEVQAQEVADVLNCQIEITNLDEFGYQYKFIWTNAKMNCFQQRGTDYCHRKG